MIDIYKTIEKTLSEFEFVSCNVDQPPLPLYHLSFNHKTLKTILDTGAATNYISNKKLHELIKLKNYGIKVYNVRTQGLQLVNSDRGGFSKTAPFKTTTGLQLSKLKLSYLAYQLVILF